MIINQYVAFVILGKRIMNLVCVIQGMCMHAGPETLFSICIPYRREYVRNFLILRLLQGILGFGTVRIQDDHHLLP